LAERSGLYKSTILRLAVSLERSGYVTRTDDGRFRLGPSTWRLGAAYRAGFDMGDIVRPLLAALSIRTNETASFYVRDGDARICLFRSEPDRSIRHSIREGLSLPLDKGASGKVLLAFSSQPDDPERLSAAEVDRIRTSGYAVSLGERDAEVAAVAVPMYLSSGTLSGALSISGLITRFDPESCARHAATLAEVQAELAARIAA
jgi:DNA-binding IclR family transcriptional regulator